MQYWFVRVVVHSSSDARVDGDQQRQPAIQPEPPRPGVPPAHRCSPPPARHHLVRGRPRSRRTPTRPPPAPNSEPHRPPAPRRTDSQPSHTPPPAHPHTAAIATPSLIAVVAPIQGRIVFAPRRRSPGCRSTHTPRPLLMHYTNPTAKPPTCQPPDAYKQPLPPTSLTPRPADRTRDWQVRTVRLLAPLAADLRDSRTLPADPPADQLVFPDRLGGPWTEARWRNWRRRLFAPAAARAGVAGAGRYERAPLVRVAADRPGANSHRPGARAGHNPSMTLRSYGHVFDEFDGSERRSAEERIAAARQKVAAASWKR